MKRNFRAIVALFVAGLMLCSAVSVFGATPTSPIVGSVGGTPIYSVVTGTGMQGVVTGSVSGQTQFASSDFASKQWGNDVFNTDYFVHIITATNITAGTVIDITDFINSTGTFTTVSAGASWAAGDRFEIISKAQAIGLMSGTNPAGRALFTLTGYAAGTSRLTDTLACPTLLAFSDILSRPGSKLNLPSDWYARVVRTDEDADTVFIGMYRIITFCAATSGATTTLGIVVAPGFDAESSSAALDAGDVIEIVPFREINPKTQVSYRGYAASGSATTAVFPDLIGRPGAINKDAWIKCIVDEAGSDEGDMSLCAVYDATAAQTGTVTFTTGILTPAVGDLYEISWSPSGEMIGGVNGAPVLPVAAHYAANVNLQEALAYASDAADSADVVAEYIRSHIDDLQSDADSLQGAKTFVLRTSSAAFNTGPTTATSSIFSGTGVWRIEALGATHTATTDAGAANLLLTLKCGAPITTLGAAVAVGSDADQLMYYVKVDSIGQAITEAAVGVPFNIPTNSRNGGYWATAQANGVGTNYALLTPPAAWTITDSLSAANTGTRYLWIRATPLSAGATLIAQ